MPRFLLSGPRLLNGLIRPGISMSGRELSAWLGVFRRKSDNALLIGIFNQNGDAEDAIGGHLAAFGFSRADAIEVRRGALMRLGVPVADDTWIARIGRSGHLCH